MDLFSYDHEELARRVQTGLDRMTVNYLRAHGAQMHRDDLDFHGFEHVDLEIKFDNHHLVVRQASRVGDAASEAPIRGENDLSSFQSTFDAEPASTVSTALIAQWLALLPAGEQKEERVKTQVDAGNPFLADVEEQQKKEPVNPFLSAPKKPGGDHNPFAPDDSDKKRRAAFDWLAGDDER